jgi:multisubunit Na+/H+ antiporter MnhG subunit
MSGHSIAEIVLLSLVVLSCWLGVIGMWVMREPVQALHYLGLPASVGMVALIAAVWLVEGNTQASWKTLLIGLVMLGTNSVLAHATARAFRARELGHWQPRDGDPMELVRERAADAARDGRAVAQARGAR